VTGEMVMSRKTILSATRIKTNAKANATAIGWMGTLLPADTVIGELEPTRSLITLTVITTKTNARAIAMVTG
jgi:hypothetical protein